jgi:TIR domain
MSTTHTFVDDVFISYRHFDNEKMDDEENGWVDNFHKGFKRALTDQLGYEPVIWRDPQLEGNVEFKDILKERIQQTAVLISILSPGYLQSDYCLSELNLFCSLAEQTGGLCVDERMRIFKVVKSHVEREKHPPEFRAQLGYEFYEINDMTKNPVKFRQEIKPNRDQRYWDKLDELAGNVSKVLSLINSRAKTSASTSVFTPSKGTIYLAETTSDLRETRNKIKSELQSHGYDILPNKELPSFSPNYEEAVGECVGRAKLSVHLIGSNYGIIPEGASGRSIIKLQNDIAAQRSRDGTFPRLLWLPVGLKPHEVEQEQFIAHLKQDSEAQRGAELLETPLEELKTHIQLRLTTNGKKAETPAGKSTPKIYLICDQRDADAVIPLIKYLKREKKYQVLLPLLDEGEEEAAASSASEKHKQNLAQCDAVLIYYGNGKQLWFENKQRDLEKIVGLERKTPLAASAIYLAAPETAHKMSVDAPSAIIIEQSGDFAPVALADFIARVESVEKGTPDAGTGN